MIAEILEDLYEYCEEIYPEEACGVIGVYRGKVSWMPCKNVADTPLTHFQLDSRDYMRAQTKMDVVAIFHSHPDGTPEASIEDLEACKVCNLPFYILSVPDRKIKKFLPQNTTYTPLIGREYRFGVYDCYSLVADYYAEKLNIHLPRKVFIDDFWEKGLDYFSDYESFGFFEVGSLKPHDLVTFSVLTDKESHCGVYLGNDEMLHHARDRLSTKESLHSFWGKYKTRILRHEDSPFAR